MTSLSKMILGRISAERRSSVSETPFYFSLAVLAAILIIRELQNARMIKGLMDRLLIKNDMEPLPEAELLAGGIGIPEQEDIDVKKKLESALRKLDQQRKERQVMFKIPGMKVGMGDISQK